ncbi:hypothetical protein RCL1_004605 [Eukaryota sp. TZLM3-RCL]
MSFVLLNGITSSELQGLSAKELLLRYPKGAFTTARTLHQTKILCLNEHIDRLKHSSMAVFDSAIPDIAEFEKLLYTTFRSAMTVDAVHYPELSCSELRITIIVTMIEHSLSFISHTATLPPVPTVPVSVKLQPYQRVAAEVKSIQWVHDRQRMEALINGNIHEVLLSESDYTNEVCILEGLSSNFFALYESNGSFVLVTCPVGLVLGGTIRKLVLEAAELVGLAVVEECPLLSKICSCFITSTSRLILPIAEMELKDGRSLRFDVVPVLCQLREALLKILDSQSCSPF